MYSQYTVVSVEIPLEIVGAAASIEVVSEISVAEVERHPVILPEAAIEAHNAVPTAVRVAENHRVKTCCE